MSFGDGRWFAGGCVFLCNPLLCFVDIFSIHEHHKILMKLLEFVGEVSELDRKSISKQMNDTSHTIVATAAR